MATWKKVIVSGSNVSQLNNDAGYLTAATTGKAFATASFNGTSLLADNSSGSLNFASSSGQGLTISANAGTDTLTFGLSAIPNSSLANSSVSIGNQTLTLGTVSPTTTLTGMTSITSTSFTGSLLGTASVSENSKVTDNPSFNSTYYPVFVQAAGNTNLQIDTSTFSYNPSTNLLTTTSSYANQALSASFASTALTASNITPAITNSTNNRVLTDNGGGTINGEANLTFDGTNLNLTGNQIISGDLTVNGTTTTINTQNLNVADKFILLSSGSTSANDGGIIVQSAIGGTGFALLYDSAQARWAFTSSLSGTATTAAPDAFIATVLDLNVAESTDIAAYQKPGNIKIATNEDIYIWS